MNALRFQGVVLSTQPMRYSPAGIAISEAVLQHHSEVEQAGITRQLHFEIDVIAMGDIAALLAAAQAGDVLAIHGFVAPLRQSSRRLVLHIQQLTRLSSPTAVV